MDEQQSYNRWMPTTAAPLPSNYYNFHPLQASQPQQMSDFPIFLDPTVPSHSHRPYLHQRDPHGHQRNGGAEGMLAPVTNSYYMPPVCTLPTLNQPYPGTFSELSETYMYPRRHSPVSSLVPATDPETVRQSRSASFNSTGAFPADVSQTASHSDFSRQGSPSVTDLSGYGYLNVDGTWSCAFAGCTSRATFTRGCDLRKHYKRHTKSLFCRHEGCPQSREGGFSSKKDRARHEAKHNPGILCEWTGCERVFSRVDNMVSEAKAEVMEGYEH